ncbi:odorant receptor 85c-like [Drosophila sulfurigaster albostrigata]|uniref:odorant receptor 85c-like n=1 Tax=Drosophila sulfurigaster albostrigata TaxID=89887 RepID=UPI002D21AC46|nr:odorant receptor 85c-like [Drosophila sulfurigaster albostrigata]
MPIAKMDSFLKYANFFYTAVGIEPYTRVSRKSAPSIWISFVFWSNIINLSLVLLGETVYVLISFATGEHVVEAIMVMSYIGFVLVGMNKMAFVWWKKESLSGIMHQLEELFPRTKETQSEYQLDRYLESCSRLSLTFSLLYSVLIWTYNLFNIAQYFVYELWLKTRIVGLTLPYMMYIPWHWEGNWSYYLLLFSQNFAGYTSAAGQVSTDLLLCAVATLIIMHYDYLGRIIEFKQLSGDWSQDSRFLAQVVQYHERLLSLSAELNEIFGVPLLLNFLISSFVICFVGFQMTIGVPPDLMIKLLLFLVSSLCQVYLICHHGQLIADASSGIALAAYKQDWSFADVRYRKTLVFIIARSQKPAFLKATVFMQITRGTMTELLQLSYKFFALLRTMYAK